MSSNMLKTLKLLAIVGMIAGAYIIFLALTKDQLF